MFCPISRGRRSWIYNFLCNRCLSLLTLWIGIPIRWGVLDTTLCDKVCQLLATGRWFSPVTPVFSTNETDRHDRTEILLKVSLYTIALTLFRCVLLLSLFHLHFIMVHFRNCSKLFYPIFLKKKNVNFHCNDLLMCLFLTYFSTPDAASLY